MSYVDYFIPDSFADRTSLEERKAQLAIKTVYVLLPWTLLVAGFVHWMYGKWSVTAGLSMLPVALVGALFALRKYESMRLASFLILAPVYAAIAGYAAISGMLIAPATSVLVLLPLLALIFSDMKSAGAWIGVVVATWIGMIAAGKTGYTGVLDVSVERYRLRRMVELLVLGGTGFGLFYLKDEFQSRLIDTLRTREAESRAVLDTTPDGILTVELDGTITWVNEAAAELFGDDPDRLVGRSIRELVENLDSEKLERKTDVQTSREYVGRRDGEEFPLKLSFGLMEASGNQRVILVARDVTERKEAERKMREARDEALEANRAKSTFLANMSHELRTPLNAVLGYSEMVLEEIEMLEETDPEAAETASDFVPDLNRIHSAGNHLLDLINDILDLSKIEAGQMQTHVEAFDATRLCEEIVESIRPLAQEKGNDFQIDIDPRLGEMCSDATKVRQILSNLLSNACKFTEDGIVRFEVRRDESTDEMVCIVEDTGIGMSADEVEQVFEAFRQADASTTREFGGTGLGLTISSHFCRLIGGSIDVTSTPGEGTRFTVRLDMDLRLEEDQQPAEAPSRRESQTATEGPTSVSAPRAEGEETTILVVDDDPTVRDLLSRMFEQWNYSVVTASNGSEGLLLADELRPDLITLDVMMPSMDGWTMLSRLQENDELEEIPVVMLSMVSEQNRGYALGVDDYLVKPVDKDALLEVLEEYTGVGGADGEILVVEDDEATRSMMERILRKEGWNVAGAEQGAEGLESARESTPDLVILDLMMPEMDGFEFLQRFREKPNYRDIPVIVVTARELTEADRRRLEEVEDVVSKGGRSHDELLDEVHRLATEFVGSGEAEEPSDALEAGG